MDRDIIKIHPLSDKDKYYVISDDCDVCGMCEIEASGNFKLNEVDDYYGAFVFKQPQTEEQYKQCNFAIDSCPTEAIHNDGEISNP